MGKKRYIPDRRYARRFITNVMEKNGYSIFDADELDPESVSCILSKHRPRRINREEAKKFILTTLTILGVEKPKPEPCFPARYFSRDIVNIGHRFEAEIT